MSDSNCFFLICIQISQEAGKGGLVFPPLEKIFTVCCDPQSQRLRLVNEAEMGVFLELSCFFDDPADIGNLISDSSAFSKTSLNIWKFTVHILLKPGLDNFQHYFTSMWEKAMAPHSSTLGWKIQWTEEPGGRQSMGPLRVGLDWVTPLSLFTFMHWRRKWQPTPVFLLGESQGRGA